MKSELEYLLENSAAVINQILYAKDHKHVCICPADTLWAGPQIDILPHARSSLQSINRMVERIQMYKGELEKMRNQLFGLDIARLRNKTMKTGRIKEPVVPMIGDLVMIHHDAKPGQDKYGVIEEIISPQQDEDKKWNDRETLGNHGASSSIVHNKGW